MDEINVSEVLKIKPVDDQRKEREWIREKYMRRKKKEQKEELEQKKKNSKSEGIIDIYA
jgi:hypothetical protein